MRELCGSPGAVSNEVSYAFLIRFGKPSLAWHLIMPPDQDDTRAAAPSAGAARRAPGGSAPIKGANRRGQQRMRAR